MDKAFQILKKLFVGINPRFLFKSYIIAGIIFYFICTNSNEIGYNSFEVLYSFLCFLIFPFSHIVWNDLISTLFGNTLFVLHPAIMIILALIKYLILYVGAVLIAPIGIIYILINQKYHSKKV